MDRGTLWATVHRVTRVGHDLSDFHHFTIGVISCTLESEHDINSSCVISWLCNLGQVTSYFTARVPILKIGINFFLYF